jgi:thioredoxin-like negative regulator of GroEL
MTNVLARLSVTLTACLVVALVGCAAPKQVAKPLPDPLVTVTAEELYRLGIEHANHGDDVRAEQYLSAAFDRGHPADEVIPALVRVCVRSSRYRAALAHTRGALARDPDNVHLRLLSASLYLAIEQPDNGRLELERVVDQDPDLALARFALGKLLAERGDSATAARHLRAYLELDAGGPHAVEARQRLRDMRAARNDRRPVRDRQSRRRR